MHVVPKISGTGSSDSNVPGFFSSVPTVLLILEIHCTANLYLQPVTISSTSLSVINKQLSFRFSHGQTCDPIVRKPLLRELCLCLCLESRAHPRKCLYQKIMLSSVLLCLQSFLKLSRVLWGCNCSTLGPFVGRVSILTAHCLESLLKFSGFIWM